MRSAFSPLREQPALVLNWLKTSLQEHNFGLTVAQWQAFWNQLSLEQQAILSGYQEGKSAKEIAKTTGLTVKQVQGQWVQLYLQAQDLRR